MTTPAPPTLEPTPQRRAAADLFTAAADAITAAIADPDHPNTVELRNWARTFLSPPSWPGWDAAAAAIAAAVQPAVPDAVRAVVHPDSGDVYAFHDATQADRFAALLRAGDVHEVRLLDLEAGADLLLSTLADHGEPDCVCGPLLGVLAGCRDGYEIRSADGCIAAYDGDLAAADALAARVDGTVEIYRRPTDTPGGPGDHDRLRIVDTEGRPLFWRAAAAVPDGAVRAPHLSGNDVDDDPAWCGCGCGPINGVLAGMNDGFEVQTADDCPHAYATDTDAADDLAHHLSGRVETYQDGCGLPRLRIVDQHGRPYFWRTDEPTPAGAVNLLTLDGVA